MIILISKCIAFIKGVLLFWIADIFSRNTLYKLLRSAGEKIAKKLFFLWWNKHEATFQAMGVLLFGWLILILQRIGIVRMSEKATVVFTFAILLVTILILLPKSAYLKNTKSLSA